jgi:hypothetical protein
MVNPQPVGVADSHAVCSDTQINYNLINNVAVLGNNVGGTFTWQAIDNPSVSGESTSVMSGGVITDVITNLTNLPQVVVYDVKF